MRKTAQSDEIVRYAEKSLWLVEFKGSVDTRKWLDQEAAALKVIMGELGSPANRRIGQRGVIHRGRWASPTLRRTTVGWVGAA